MPEGEAFSNPGLLHQHQGDTPDCHQHLRNDGAAQQVIFPKYSLPIQRLTIKHLIAGRLGERKPLRFLNLGETLRPVFSALIQEELSAGSP